MSNTNFEASLSPSSKTATSELSSSLSCGEQLSPSDLAFIQDHGRLYRALTHSAFDPFRRHDFKPPTLYIILRYVCIPFLLGIRLFAAIIAIFISYIIVMIFGPSVTKDSLKHFRPTLLPPWRRKIVQFATKLLARSLLFAFGFWTIPGKDHPDFDPKQASRATIVSNHSSVADPCLLAYLFAPAFVAKSQVNKLPGIGRVGAAQHAFYIDRMDNAGISVTDHIIMRQRLVLEAAVPIPPVAIFPEGTTTNGKYLLPFKTGAFVAALPIAPVLIRFSHDYFSPTLETIPSDKYIWGMVTQFANHLQYYRLPVYYPNDEEKANPKLFADNVRKYMSDEYKKAFGKKLIESDSNYIDKMEYHSIIRGKPLKKDLKLNKDS